MFFPYLYRTLWKKPDPREQNILPSAGTSVTVSVSGNILTLTPHSVTVTTGSGATLSGNSLALSSGHPTVSAGAIVNVSGNVLHVTTPGVTFSAARLFDYYITLERLF